MKRLKIIKEIINTEVTYIVDSYCCEKMKKALTLLDKTFYSHGHATFTWNEKGKVTVDIYIKNSYGSTRDDVGCTECELDYCPFCGEKI